MRTNCLQQNKRIFASQARESSIVSCIVLDILFLSFLEFYYYSVTETLLFRINRLYSKSKRSVSFSVSVQSKQFLNREAKNKINKQYRIDLTDILTKDWILQIDQKKDWSSWIIEILFTELLINIFSDLCQRSISNLQKKDLIKILYNSADIYCKI